MKARLRDGGHFQDSISHYVLSRIISVHHISRLTLTLNGQKIKFLSRTRYKLSISDKISIQAQCYKIVSSRYETTILLYKSRNLLSRELAVVRNDRYTMYL